MMFSIKNTYCVCMIYCNYVLWFINTTFVLYDFLKCFVYYIVDIWMPIATHEQFASNEIIDKSMNMSVLIDKNNTIIINMLSELELAR
jgi:hypothetical protein